MIKLKVQNASRTVGSASTTCSNRIYDENDIVLLVDFEYLSQAEKAVIASTTFSICREEM